jgi:WD40 repeat protein
MLDVRLLYPLKESLVTQWKRVGSCATGPVTDRFWHAGLSPDGSRCFVGAVDDETYFVWDIATASVIWVDDGDDDTTLPASLAESLTDGWFEIRDGAGAGRYRVFGLESGESITHSSALGIDVAPCLKGGIVEIMAAGGREILQRLSYRVLSGDWAFASFSEDGHTLAVLEPYEITFYRYS